MTPKSFLTADLFVALVMGALLLALVLLSGCARHQPPGGDIWLGCQYAHC